ncbi:GGDEF domain-containing protein [Stenotrophomonas sp. SRS1]|uniref:GGDEF domain-containing protein n=1 Tax=Stenotrophomonas sp. SRS1 TaxID=2870345 RepID=UPI002237F733|nr:GGDEF domain-containing protein [Stenotrophomonas sp. SRS1]MCW6029346.1 GGDEF domain-containing protein [Stenotrophomonas sp. SRS1]
MRMHLLRQPSHYLFVLPAVLVALGLWAATPAAEAGSSVHRLLPMVLACLGVGLALIYNRVRALCLMLAIALAFALLHGVVGTFLREGMISAQTPLIFHAVSWWLPLLFLLHGLWPERGRLRQDLLLRGVVSGTALGIFLLLATQVPDGMQALLSDRHLAWLPSDWNALAQLPALLFLITTVALAVQAWRRPRPLHTALLIALLCLWWLLPRVFVSPALLPAVSCMALLLIVSAMLQEAFHMAFRDELTGLPGRRAFNEYLQRVGATYTIAMVDVDHFKRFNDTHGHDAGDDVLKLVAARLAEVGGGGRAFRYGGEEFALVFLDRPAPACVAAVEEVRARIEGVRMHLRDRAARSRDDAVGQLQRGRGGNGAVVQVTVSIGVADSRVADSPQAMIKAADQALYAAKDAGRNCVCALGQQGTVPVRATALAQGNASR